MFFYGFVFFRQLPLILIGLCQMGAAGGRASAAEPFRLLSYNIHHGEGMDKKVDLARLAIYIREQKPDAVALQEVDRNCARSGKVDQPAELARLTGMIAHFHKAMDYDGGEYGLCMLTKEKPVLTIGIALPNSEKPVEPRAGHAVRVPTPGGFLTIANTHLEVSSANLRVVQVKYLLRELESLPGPVLLAGDFNSVRLDPTMSAVTAAGWEVPEKQGNPNTVPVGTPRREIDFAVIHPARALKVLKYEVLDQSLYSDHRPILIEVVRAVP